MNWKVSVISSVIVVILSIALQKVSGLNFWACLALVVGAMLFNGYIATIEDDWPGGFNNPDPQPSNAQRRVAQITEHVLRSLFGKSR
jgi:hypothetical protein